MDKFSRIKTLAHATIFSSVLCATTAIVKTQAMRGGTEMIGSLVSSKRSASIALPIILSSICSAFSITRRC